MILYTSNLSYDGADRIDISQHADPDTIGAVLAPTAELIGAYKHGYWKMQLDRYRTSLARKYSEAERELAPYTGFGQLTESAYVNAYFDLIRSRHQHSPERLSAILLLPMEEITLCCECLGHQKPNYCHRFLAAEIVAKVAKQLNVSLALGLERFYPRQPRAIFHEQRAQKIAEDAELYEQQKERESDLRALENDLSAGDYVVETIRKVTLNPIKTRKGRII